MKRIFLNFNKEELLKKIDQIQIEQSEDCIVTKFEDRVLSVVKVSSRYEIFDIKNYIKSKIEIIEKNFNITKYYLRLSKGVQELTLLSDPVEIQGVSFRKSFFILNSSDKSRRLSFNAGLYCESKKFYIVPTIKNVGLIQKHLKGVTQAANLVSEGLDGESFKEQIDSISKLCGHKISLLNLKKTIVKNDDIKAEHMKFDAFKNALIYYSSEGRLKLTDQQFKTLKTQSEALTIDNSNDFYIDAFWAFQVYMRLFNNQDSHIVKRETERIMSMTVWSVRNQLLETLGI